MVQIAYAQLVFVAVEPCLMYPFRTLLAFLRLPAPQVWSNGDVVINSGGKGMSPSTLVILNLVLGVFKVEVRRR